MAFQPVGYVPAIGYDNGALYRIHNLTVFNDIGYVAGLGGDIMTRVVNLGLPQHFYAQIILSIEFDGEVLIMSTPFKRIDELGLAVVNLVNRAGDSKGIEINYSRNVRVTVTMKIIPVGDANAPPGVVYRQLRRARFNDALRANWNPALRNPVVDLAAARAAAALASARAKAALFTANSEALRQSREVIAGINARQAAEDISSGRGIALRRSQAVIAGINARQAAEDINRGNALRRSQAVIAGINARQAAEDINEREASRRRRRQESNSKINDDFTGKRQRYFGLENTGEEHTSALLKLIRKTRTIEYFGNTDTLCVPRALLYIIMRKVMGYHIIKRGSSSAAASKVTLFAKSPEMVEHFMSVLDRVYAIPEYQSRFNPTSKQIRMKLTGSKFKELAYSLAKFCNVDCSNGVGAEGLKKFEEVLNIRIRVYKMLGGYTKVYDGSPDRGGDYFNLLEDGNHVHPIRNMASLKGCKYLCEECDTYYTSRFKHIKCPYRCKFCTTKECDFHMVPENEGDGCGEAKVQPLLIADEALDIPNNAELIPRPCVNCGITYPSENCFDFHIKSGICDNRKSCPNPECKWFTLEIYKKCGKLHSKEPEGVDTCNSLHVSRWREVHTCGDTVCVHCGAFIVGGCETPHNCFMRPLISADIDGVSPTLMIYFDFESAVVKTLINPPDDQEGVEPDAPRYRSDHVTSHVVTKSVLLGELVEGEDPICEALKVFQPKADGDFKEVLGDFMRWALAPERTAVCYRIGVNGERLLNKAGVPRTTNVSPTFVAHNGKGYDFHFCFNWMMRQNMDVEVVRAGSKIMYMTTEDGSRFIDSYNFVSQPLSQFPKVFGLSELKKGYFPHKLNTLTTQNYVGDFPDKSLFFTASYKSESSLEAFDQWHGSESKRHIEEDINYDFRKEIIGYCKSDVELLAQGCESFRAIYREAAGIDPFGCVTIAGACMKAFRTTYLKEDTISVLKKDMIAFIRREFSGGRTGVGRSYANVSSHVAPIDTTSAESTVRSSEFNASNRGRSIEYIDIVSLYPSVNSNAEYPYGAPHWREYAEDGSTLASALNDISTVIGFYEVDITPPNDLLHPVLPEKSKGKLLFPLYPMASVVHTSHELRVALSQGYEITKVYRGLCWNESTTELFKEYVKSFMKLKYESKTWSKKTLDGAPVTSEAQKVEWVEACLRLEGINIDPANVCDNPGLYAIAKLCLNSLWGKFGQNSNPSKCIYTEDLTLILETLLKYSVNSINAVPNSSKYEVIYEFSDGEQECPNTNVALAAFTTSHARLRLYDAMSKLGPQFLYSDTDSIVFEHHLEGGPWLTSDLDDTRLAEGMKSPYDPWPISGVCRLIPTGTRLGEWEDEDASAMVTFGEGVNKVKTFYKKTIVEHVALAPKTYAHKFNDGSFTVKSKGFGVTLASKNQLNFDNYVSALMSLSNPDINYESVVTEPTRIHIDRSHGQVITLMNMTKRFKPTLDQKGVYDLASYNLVPFGSLRGDIILSERDIVTPPDIEIEFD